MQTLIRRGPFLNCLEAAGLVRESPGAAPQAVGQPLLPVRCELWVLAHMPANPECRLCRLLAVSIWRPPGQGAGGTGSGEGRVGPHASGLALKSLWWETGDPGSRPTAKPPSCARALPPPFSLPLCCPPVARPCLPPPLATMAAEREAKRAKLDVDEGVDASEVVKWHVVEGASRQEIAEEIDAGGAEFECEYYHQTFGDEEKVRAGMNI